MHLTGLRPSIKWKGWEHERGQVKLTEYTLKNIESNGEEHCKN